MSSFIFGDVNNRSNRPATQFKTQKRVHADYDVSRFNIVNEAADQNLLVDEWIGRGSQPVNKLYRNIYLRDPISGSTIDLVRSLPFSPFHLIGIEDKKVLQIYQDCLDTLDITNALPEISALYLIEGKCVISLIFDEIKGYFSSIMPIDTDYLRITPIPITNVDPMVDFKITQNMRQFLQSADPRAIYERKKLPPVLIKQFLSGSWVPLQPDNVLYLPRKSTPIDYIGTSYLTRVLPYWMLEKALLDATTVSARRRVRSIMHITCGDEQWEPDMSEVDAIVSSFISADEDPVGAVVGTRRGVEINEVRSGSDFWKISDEWSFLSEAKMRALGVNDAFLSGDASYNTLEAALSVFVESLRTFREQMTSRIFYKKLFPLIARANGIVKRKQAELAHRIRTTSDHEDQREVDLSNTVTTTPDYFNNKKIISPSDNLTIKRPQTKDAKEIPNSQLLMPEINWDKKLRPEADSNYLEILEKAEEHGVPITLRTWASACGIDVDQQLNMLGQDSELRKKVEDWKKATGVGKSGEEGGEDFSFSAIGKVNDINEIPIWRNDEFLGITKKEAIAYLNKLFSNKTFKNMIKKGSSSEEIKKVVFSVLNKDEKVEPFSYILKRTGLVPQITVTESTLNNVSAHIYKKFRNHPKKLFREMEMMSKMFIKPYRTNNKSALKKEVLSGFLNRSKDRTVGKNIFGGVN